MKKFKHIDEFLRECKYWSGPHDPRYGYFPVVAPIVLPPGTETQLKDIGKLIVLYTDKVNQIVGEAINDPSKDKLSAFLYRMAKHASSGFNLIPTDKRVPICKVDLILSEDGLKIAEIDAYNPRGIPYAVLLSNIYDVPSEVEEKVAAHLKGKNMTWLYANHERYYTNVLEAMCQILQKNSGASLSIQNCDTVSHAPDYFTIIPWGLRAPHEVTVRELLQEKSAQGGSWYPVTPWLSSKSFLGFIWHQIREGSCSVEIAELSKRFIPETFLVHPNFVDVTQQHENFILKPTVSSGHKGVQRNNTDLKALFGKTPSHIIQKFSPPQNVTVPFYSKEGTEQKDSFFLRVTAYYDHEGNFLEAEATGRREWLVHGSSDCIMGPIVL